LRDRSIGNRLRRGFSVPEPGTGRAFLREGHYVQKAEDTDMRTDSELQQAVIRELSWDSRVRETEIGVQVDRGVVALTGTLGSWAERAAAQEAAHRVAGVHDVVNDIIVEPPVAHHKTDTELAHAVRTSLQWDVLVPEERIRSTISHGVVTLTGEVDFGSQREDAELAVRNLAGVRQVLNDIRVKPAKVVKPEEVRTAIESALARRTMREVNRIALEIDEGRVTLGGYVHSWAERRAALGAAKSTPGVICVVDHLRIEP
jgi:osmotically-inducible protein OsmY